MEAVTKKVPATHGSMVVDGGIPVGVLVGFVVLGSSGISWWTWYQTEIAGFVLARFTGFAAAGPIGLLLGLLIAARIPAKTACGIRGPAGESPRDAA